MVAVAGVRESGVGVGIGGTVGGILVAVGGTATGGEATEHPASSTSKLLRIRAANKRPARWRLSRIARRQPLLIIPDLHGPGTRPTCAVKRSETK